MPEPYRVLNLGAGKQSTALYLMSVRQDEPEHVPVFDYAIFGDPQAEREKTYRHIEWLQSLGGPPILIRTTGNIVDDLLRDDEPESEGRFASAPFFTKTEGRDREGRLPRQCTKEYKTEVVEQTIKRELFDVAPRCRVPDDKRSIQYFGLSSDETGRIVAVQARVRATYWSEPRFPLFDLQMTRLACIEYLEKVAPKREIPRSSCVFCPYHSNAEWREIRDTSPADWERACQIDEALRQPGKMVNRGLDASLYVHRSLKPLREAPIDSPESRGEQHQFGFAQECEGLCGV